MDFYRRVFPYLRPHLGKLGLAGACMLGFVVFNIASVGLVMPFVDTMFKPVPTEVPAQEVTGVGLGGIKAWMGGMLDGFIRRHDRMDVLLFLCVAIVLTFLLKNLFAILQTHFMASVEQGLMRDLRVALYAHLHKLSLSYFTEERKGNILSRLTNDIRIVNDSIMAVINSFLRDPPQIVAYGTVLMVFNWKLTLMVMLVLPVTGLIIGKIGDTLKRASISSQEKMADLTAILEETLSGIRIVKAFGMETFEIEKFKTETARYKNIMLKLVRRRAFGGPVAEMVGITAVAVLLWFMGREVLRGESGMTPGGFVFYVAMIYQIMQPLKLFTQAFNSHKEGVGAGSRVFSILDEHPRILSKPDALRVRTFEERIDYRDVSFRYDTGRQVLHEVSFTLRKGEVLALVGRSGSGKSTIADLLPRFYDVTGGSILLDSRDLRDLDVGDLRSLIGIVAQETTLFNDTVRNNIAYGRPEVTDEQLMEAARAANAHGFVQALPKGYDTTIGDRGVKLSGGERQRLALARALLKNPPILILDEATSALDTESEMLVQEAIERLMSGRTTLVIAHRLSTVQKADTIIVIEDGRIRESGRHEELLARPDGLYKRLYDLQFRG